MSHVKPLTRKPTPTPRPQEARPKPTPRSTPTAGYRGKSPLAIIVYGPPGVGKTEFAANFPGAGFVYDPQEDGVMDLMEFGKCPTLRFTREVSRFEQTLDVCDELAAGRHDVQTVVFDSFTGFEKLCFAYHCEQHFDSDWSSKGFYSFQQGPKNAAKTDIPRLLDAFNDVRRAGINVILIAHSQEKRYENPEGADYTRFTPTCDKESWHQLSRWAKAILFYNYHVDILVRKGTDKLGRGKAQAQTEARYIYTEWSPAYDAKNRYGLSPLIDAGGNGREAYAAFEADFDRAAGKAA